MQMDVTMTAACTDQGLQGEADLTVQLISALLARTAWQLLVRHSEALMSFLRSGHCWLVAGPLEHGHSSAMYDNDGPRVICADLHGEDWSEMALGRAA